MLKIDSKICLVKELTHLLCYACNLHTTTEWTRLESRTYKLVELRIAEGTTKCYGYGPRAFIRFATFYEYIPIMPATDIALAAFVSFQSQSCTHDTLHGYISHVKGLHLSNGFNFKPIAERWLVKSALIGIRRAFGAQKRKKMVITVDMLLRVHSAISNGFARNMGIHMLQSGVYGLPFWLASSPCCGKIIFLLEKPELSIFTTAHFVKTWYWSRKQSSLAALQIWTDQPVSGTCTHCPIAIHWWQIVPGTGVQCTLGEFPPWFWAITVFHV